MNNSSILNQHIASKKPIFFSADSIDINTLKEEASAINVTVNEDYSVQLQELQEMKNDFTLDASVFFDWVFFPWEKIIAPIVKEEFFLQLRTYRNKYLISSKEQQKFYDLRVGLAGLSVGHSVLTTTVLHGGVKSFKMIDSDYISVTNLNRLKTPFYNIGRSKLDVAVEDVYGLNPYANIIAIRDVLDEKNIEHFFLDPKIDAFVDEIDNLKMKVLSRKFAKKCGIPVVMATDAEDHVIIDVERYDLDDTHPIFHGILDDDDIEHILSEHTNKQDFIRIGKKLIGEENISREMDFSLEKIGTELQSVPQLATASMVAGSVAAKALRGIATGQEKKSYRKVIKI